MTVIAWDGQVLAADRMVCLGDTIFKSRKIERISETTWAAGSGSPMTAQVMAFLKGQAPYPKWDKDESFSVLVVKKGFAESWLYTLTEYPEILISPIAIGSGRDFAMTALHLDKSATEAVEIASQLCASCGGGIDDIKVN